MICKYTLYVFVDGERVLLQKDSYDRYEWLYISIPLYEAFRAELRGILPTVESILKRTGSKPDLAALALTNPGQLELYAIGGCRFLITSTPYAKSFGFRDGEFETGLWTYAENFTETVENLESMDSELVCDTALDWLVGLQ